MMSLCLNKMGAEPLRPAEGRSFEGVRGVLHPENFLKVTLKSMHINRGSSRVFFFIIVFISWFIEKIASYIGTQIYATAYV